MTGRAGAVLRLVGVALLTLTALTWHTRSARGATPSAYMAGQGESFPEQAVMQLERDAGNANVIGGLTPTYLAGNALGEEGALGNFAQGQADFAVTGQPLNSAEMATAASSHITPAYVPYATGAVAIVAAVTVRNQAGTVGLLQGLKLKMSTLAKIYTGQITSWKDAEIFTENPGLTYELNHVVEQPPTIDPVARQDSTATNSAFFAAIRANSKASAAFGPTIPATGQPADRFPSTGIGTPVTGGSAAVAQHMRHIDPSTGIPSNQPASSIGYVSIAWAQQYSIPLVAMENLAGNYVAADAGSIGSAMSSGATFDPSTNLYSISKTFDYSAMTDPAAYPIPLPDYLVVPQTGDTAPKENAVAGFVNFALGSTGQQDVTANGMVPPNSSVAAAGKAVASAMIAAATTTTSTTTSTTSNTSTTSTSVTPTSTAAQGSSTTSTTAGGVATTTTSTGNRAVAAAASNGGSSASSNPRSSSGAQLPSTGGSAAALGAFGVGAIVAGDLVRQRARRRRRP